VQGMSGVAPSYWIFLETGDWRLLVLPACLVVAAALQPWSLGFGRAGTAALARCTFTQPSAKSADAESF
jgi:hypothetical protein